MNMPTIQFPEQNVNKTRTKREQTRNKPWTSLWEQYVNKWWTSLWEQSGNKQGIYLWEQTGVALWWLGVALWWPGESRNKRV